MSYPVNPVDIQRLQAAATLVTMADVERLAAEHGLEVFFANHTVVIIGPSFKRQILCDQLPMYLRKIGLGTDELERLPATVEANLRLGYVEDAIREIGAWRP